MNEKNMIINNYTSALTAMISNLSSTLAMLGDSLDVNNAIIRTADIQITSINSQLVVLQNALDTYGG